MLSLDPSIFDAFVYLFLFFIVVLTLYSIYLLTRLYQNYRHALLTGLPVYFTPFEPMGLPWMLLYSNFGWFLGRFRCCRLIVLTWAWEDDDKWHRELGETFVLVNTENCTVASCDPVVVEWVLTRRKEFPKPWVYEGLNLFGRNVDTVNGQEWTRHRKLTAPCFNERVSSFVWTESLRQSTSMVETWLAAPSGRITTMIDDTRIIALHVLYAAGFGTQHDFTGGKRLAEPGHALSHRDALVTILDNIIPAIIMCQMKGLVEKWSAFLGVRLNKILLAVREFTLYTDEAIAAERQALARGEQKLNLMSTLIRTSDQAQAEGVQSAVRLTDDEIKGNIFIFNLAGHDTTANTLGYAFALLACNPEVQDWVIEEIDGALGEGQERYEEVYPRLKRVVAVFWETLRLYGPVGHIPRAVATPNTSLPTSNSTILIPPNTQIVLKTHAMHTTAKHFVNPTVWMPHRWIAREDGVETLLESPAFFPFSGGPRICPGMKMAQVEFAGVLSTVLRKVVVRPGGRGGEEARRKELMRLLRDSNNDGPTLKISRAEDVCMEVTKR